MSNLYVRNQTLFPLHQLVAASSVCFSTSLCYSLSSVSFSSNTLLNFTRTFNLLNLTEFFFHFATIFCLLNLLIPVWLVSLQSFSYQAFSFMTPIGFEIQLNEEMNQYKSFVIRIKFSCKEEKEESKEHTFPTCFICKFVNTLKIHFQVKLGSCK